MKIGYIYYTYYPVTGGASVHGINLARELSALGHHLYKVNGDADPYTTKIKRPVFGVWKMIRDCDLVYVRMDYFLKLRNLIAILTLVARKPLIVELNTPSDELHLFGRGKWYIRFADRIMKQILRRADAVVVVSEPVKKYCTEALNLENVHVVENGGESFEDLFPEDTPLAGQIRQIRQNYRKLVVWSGSINQMQDLEGLEKLAAACPDAAIISVIKREKEGDSFQFHAENIFTFEDLEREDVKYIISQCDIGLAFYRDYPWSRWGFYNSSLKVYEYLANGLMAVTNKKGTRHQQNNRNFIHVENVADAESVIRNGTLAEPGDQPIRTWQDTAREIDQIMNHVIHSRNDG
jgi:glycosyltransferase involved in cell wall biosynthesis